jgi:hypothetical protein
MKKNIVLFVLFVLPIVAYMFFASGVNGFITLPTITKAVPDVHKKWHSLDGKEVTLNNKITILGFAGNDLLQHSGDYFTLNQKIYSNYKGFKDFQFVFIAPEGTEEQALKLETAFGKLSEMSGYHFVFAPLNEIQAYYSKLHLIGKLDVTGHTPLVFIVDKKRNLRGRKGKSVQGEAEYKEGYNTTSAAELHNEMVDDVKILLAEYRLALKRNNSQRKI